MSRKGNTAAFEEQLKRIHCSAGTRTQVELAAFLDIRQSSVADAKKRQSIPAEWLIKLLQQKGINPEWILSGHGSRYLRPADDNAVTVIRMTEIRPPEHCTTEELVTEVVRRSLETI